MNQFPNVRDGAHPQTVTSRTRRVSLEPAPLLVEPERIRHPRVKRILREVAMAR